VRWFLLQQNGPPTFGGHRHGSWAGQATLMVPRISRVPHGTSVAGATEVRAGYVGRRAARLAFASAGLSPIDVDVCELYDPFSFEIIRQLEAFGFCPEGEGGSFVEGGAIAPTGVLPVTTDGGTMSFAHPGNSTQMLQRVIRAVEQARGSCRSAQVAGAEVALCSKEDQERCSPT
jgi:acetyl-CoA acetyltransferase